MNTAPKLHSTILQAVARGWCAPENAPKVMDCDLAEAITREVIAALAPPSGEGVDDAVVLEALRKHIKLFKSQQEFAKAHDVSPQYVSDVLAGRRHVPETWVAVLGYRKAGWVYDPSELGDLAITWGTTPQAAPVDGVVLRDGDVVIPVWVIDSARRIAIGMHAQNYMEDAPNWQPFDDLAGILSQISNMVAGMEKKGATPPPASQERGGDSIVLDAYQLRCAAELAAPDYDQDEDQRGTELVFQSLPERVIDGETLPAGMYCWYSDLPEEGALYLEEYEEYEARMTKAASPLGAASLAG